MEEVMEVTPGCHLEGSSPWLCHKANRSEFSVSQSRQLILWAFDCSFMSLTVTSFSPRKLEGWPPPWPPHLVTLHGTPA